MGTKIAAAGIAVALVVYFVVIGQYGITLIQSDDVLLVIMGIATLGLPVIGAWALIREVIFGFRANALEQQLAAEEMPGDSLPRTPSGKVEREAADADFETWAEIARQEPDNWRAWFKLGIAYFNAGDSKRARKAIRKAIALQRAAR